MPSEIEKLWEIESDDHFSVNYRTSCDCTTEDHAVTFGVNVDVGKDDERYGQVWLDVSVNTYYWSDVWDTPGWSYPFRTFWLRLKTCITLMFRGCVEVNHSFIFRGNEQIDEFVETIIEAQKKSNKKIESKES